MSVVIDPLVLALISAAGGASVSSVFVFVGQVLERRSKRKEILFNASMAQAKQRVATCLEIAKLTGREGSVPDEAILAGTYYRWLQHLYDHGKLPQEAIDAEKASDKELEESRARRKKDKALHNERLVEQASQHPLKARQLLAASQDLSWLTDEQYSILEESASRSYP